MTEIPTIPLAEACVFAVELERHLDSDGDQTIFHYYIYVMPDGAAFLAEFWEVVPHEDYDHDRIIEIFPNISDALRGFDDAIARWKGGAA